MFDFRLRPWTLEDVEDLTEYANNLKVAQNLTDAFPHPYAIEDAYRFIKMCMELDPPTIMAIEIEGRASGGIGIHPQTDIHRLNAELGYWLAEPYWGQGIMTKAISQMVDYAFRTLEINRIFARPFGTNIASQRVLEKTGFILEARFDKTLIKNGILLDELIYAIRRPV